MEEKAKKQFFEKLQKSTKLKGTIEIVTGVCSGFFGNASENGNRNSGSYRRANAFGRGN